ncbi:hypothetical protein LTS18_007924, partial [Coniosporium uncinatum]
IDLKFINRYRDCWPPAIQCLSSGLLDLKRLVSHTFPLERAMDAMAMCADLTKGSIKVHVTDDTDL